MTEQEPTGDDAHTAQRLASQTEEFCTVVHHFAQAMHDWRTAQEITQALSVRIGRRTTQIIRFTMVALVAISVIMGGLILVLTTYMQNMSAQMTSMSVYMGTMQDRFVIVAARMDTMNDTMSRINENIGIMPALNASVARISTHVERMTTDVALMRENLTAMVNEIHTIKIDLSTMNVQMRQMSRPMDFFPF